MKGLARNASTGMSTPASLITSAARPDMKIALASGRAMRNRSASSLPLIPGMMMSVRRTWIAPW